MPTLKEIAARADVSEMTVCNVLTGRIQPTRPSAVRRAERIRRIAAEMGYRPNTAARATRTQRFGAAALLFRQEQSFFPLQLVRGLHRALALRNMHLVFDELPTGQAVKADGYAPKMLRELCVDGLLIHHAIQIAPQVIDLIREQGIPAVWINTQDSTDCVYPDDGQGAELSVRRLLALGHRRIAYLAFTTSEQAGIARHYSEVSRAAGYARAVAAAGLEPYLVEVPVPGTVLSGADPDDRRVEQALELLRGPDRPTAVVARTAHEAGPLVVAARVLGLEVPRDLSVITFQPEVQSITGCAISTMVIPMERVGREAVDMLLQKVGNVSEPIPSLAVPYSEERGFTCDAPPGAR